MIVIATTVDLKKNGALSWANAFTEIRRDKMEGFFKHCLETAKNKYDRLLNTPKSRGGKLNDEIKEIIVNIERSIRFGELAQETGKELIKEFESIDFSRLSVDRAEIKKREKLRA